MRRAIVCGALALAALAAAGTATGYWTAGGTGAGAAGVASPAALVISPATPTGLLLPTGVPSAGLGVTVQNPNPFSVHVSQLALDPAQGSGGFSANAASCALSFATQTNGGAGWDIAPGATATINLPGSVSMGSAAANSCQGQTFTVYLAAS